MFVLERYANDDGLSVAFYGAPSVEQYDGLARRRQPGRRKLQRPIRIRCRGWLRRRFARPVRPIAPVDAPKIVRNRAANGASAEVAPIALDRSRIRETSAGSSALFVRQCHGGATLANTAAL